MAGIEPFHVMSILARAKALEDAGRDIIHMEVGEPDFDTPAPIIQAGQRALAQGLTKYTAAAGLPALREAIAGYYLKRYGITVDPARILVTPGASGALQLILAALVNPDQQVLMPDPAYPCNRHMVRLFDGEAVALPTRGAEGFVLTPEQVAGAWSDRSRALMLATPANPTGACLSLDELAAHYANVRRLGGALVVDEIYQGLEYGRDSVTALALGEEDLFVVNSFSKFFGMTGWRVGWLVAPAEWVPVLERLAQNIFLAAPTVSQHAALAAFSPDSLAIMDQQRRVLAERRDLLMSALAPLGFKVAGRPEGAFYLYADCSALAEDAALLAADLLEEVGVAVTPGLDFGSLEASTYLRFAYTTDAERLAEGVQRIRDYLSARA
jgi:aspartate/methionine/tyrosine aminotransferase